jgi:hypothetical protein
MARSAMAIATNGRPAAVAANTTATMASAQRRRA